jgi:hypothetical protein
VIRQCKNEMGMLTTDMPTMPDVCLLVVMAGSADTWHQPCASVAMHACAADGMCTRRAEDHKGMERTRWTYCRVDALVSNSRSFLPNTSMSMPTFSVLVSTPASIARRK